MKIAYLAPEIPALSATFVYKEINKLKDLGLEIVPFSVHIPSSIANEPELNELKKQVIHLYERSKRVVIVAHIYLLFRHPLRYFTNVGHLLSDMAKVGFLSRNASGLVFRFFYAGSLAKDLIQKNCQHLHVHFAHVPTDIAMYAASLSGITFSVTAHANDLFERGWLLKEKVARSQFFATISEFNKLYLQNLGIDTDKIRIVRCGVDEEQFEPRQGFNSKAKIKIGVVGRLIEKKGIDTLINAIKTLKDNGYDIALHIAGSGPLKDHLTQQMSDCMLDSDDIIFVGAIDNTLVAKFITSLDIFVLPCKMDRKGDMDGIPVVLMEAMLSGVPVISSRLSGIPELIIDKKTGLLITPDDSQSLVDAISLMLINENLRKTMVEQAIIKVKQEFSLLSNTTYLYEMFSEVITNNKSRKYED